MLDQGLKEKSDMNGTPKTSEKEVKNGNSLESNPNMDDKLGNLIFELVDTIHTMGLPIPPDPQVNKPK